MDYSALISAVETHKCLYDKGHKEYKNILIKETVWGEIATITGFTKDDCKKRWGFLREKFNKEIKKRDMPTGSEAPIYDEWPYLKSLMFLKEFIQPRKTKSNSTETEESATEESPAKRHKPDSFADTCVTFNNILKSIQAKSVPKENDIDQQFFKTLCLLYKELPETVKNQARIDLMSHVSNLRLEHLK